MYIPLNVLAAVLAQSVTILVLDGLTENQLTVGAVETALNRLGWPHSVALAPQHGLAQHWIRLPVSHPYLV